MGSEQNRATLYVFAGLPGAGKSTLAQMLCASLGCSYLRIDSIEQSLRDVCGIVVEGEGYSLAYRLAADNLKLGNSVVADSCNPVGLTREAWRSVAESQNCRCVDIEVVCSDTREHRQRVETRTTEVQDLVLPTWQQVVDREYDPWSSPRIVIDTAGVEPEQALQTLLHALDLADQD